MKKFGFGKKDKAAAAENPYAQQAPMTAYDRAKVDAGVRPAPGGGLPSGPRGGLPSGPKAGMGRQMNNSNPAPTPAPAGGMQSPNPYGGGGSGGYTAQPGGSYGADSQGGGYGSDNYGSKPSGYGAEKFGDQGGYGADRYGGGNPYGGGAAGGNSKYGAGGYGGLGRTNSAETAATDDNRDALFGGAKDRYEQKQSTSSYGSQPPPYGEDGQNGGYNPSGERSYGAYGDRELTAEEAEEEDVQGAKQEIKQLKQQDVSSTRNALAIAAQAEETGRNTLARLGAQGESIHNTEKNLDLAANHNRYAEERARELKTLNRSMFAVHVNNPFTKNSRQQKREDDIMKRHHAERDQRETTRNQAYESSQRMEQTFKDIEARASAPAKKANLADRAKYQFEADSEDDDMENEIENNLDLLSGAAGRLNALARATGKEVEEQNRHLERIAGKSDFVDDQIAMNRAKLDRIK